VLAHALHDVLQRIENAARAAQRPVPRLLAVSKTRTSGEIAALAAAMRDRCPADAPAFGENYVQEAAAKARELTRHGIEWHLIGHLQSNKAALAAEMFDWVQTVDRAKVIAALANARPADRAPLNVLIQVNIDDEVSKHGCTPADVPALADAIAAQPRLALRGLMAIPAPAPDPARRREAFRAMRDLHETLARQYRQADTLSMGMSDDFELAIEEGSTMVRVGTALFGRRESGMGNRE
jgi:pyridoxal phosphate enzyme (YggS family)